MRLCLIDDNAHLLEYLKAEILKFQARYSVQCCMSLYNSAEEMLFENPDAYPFDLIILDIGMEGMNGIELAKEIRKRDKKVPLAFLSAMSDYVFEGYEVQAIRYLMKPVQQEQLFKLLQLTHKELSKENRFLIVNSSSEKIKVDYDDIYYVEASGHYIYIYLEKSSYEMKGSISLVGKELCSTGFVFTHRSYVVNLRHVDIIGKEECTLSDGRHVPVSRGAYKEVNDAFIAFYKDGGF